MTSWGIGSSTEVIERKLGDYVSVLASTHTTALERWTEATVVETFTVTDFVVEVMAKSDDLQVQAIGGRLAAGLHVSVLQEDMEVVLRQPAVAILLAVMASPFLSAVPRRIQVMLECVDQCYRRVGREETVRAVTNVLRRGFRARATRNKRQEEQEEEQQQQQQQQGKVDQQQGQKQQWSAPSPEKNWVFGGAEGSLAVDLLLVLDHQLSGAVGRGHEQENESERGHEHDREDINVQDSGCLLTSSAMRPLPPAVLSQLRKAVSADDRTLAVVMAAWTMPFPILLEQLSTSMGTQGATVETLLATAERLVLLQAHPALATLVLQVSRQSPCRLLLPYGGGYAQLLLDKGTDIAKECHTNLMDASAHEKEDH
jgi:hypothetical protein